MDSKSKQQEFIIENQTEDREIDLNLIYKNGYSSKSERRGLGLGNVRDILKKYNNVSISTEYIQCVFTQKITLRET